LSYQWRFNGAELPGATNATLVLTDTSPTLAGLYSVAVSNRFGTVDSTPTTLTLLPAADIKPMTQTTFVGSSLSFTAASSSSLPLSYQWRLNGVDLPGATNRELNLQNAQLSDAGLYSVSVEGLAGRVPSPAASAYVTQVAVWGLDSQTNVLGNLTDVAAVAGGVFHTIVLRGDGTVVGWGFGNSTANDRGQTQPPPGLSNVVAIAAGDYHSLALKADGTVVGWGDSQGGKTVAPPGLTNAVAIAAGFEHSLSLIADGTVVAWGAGAYGQTAVPTGLSNVVAISAAGFLSLALTADGRVAAWGGYNPPILPPALTNLISIAASDNGHGLALTGEGSLIAFTLDGTIQTNTPPGLTNVTMIAASNGHYLAATADGGVIGWPDIDVPSQLANVTALSVALYQGMAVVKGIAPASQPVLRNPSWGARGFGFSVDTQSGRVYRPEYKLFLNDNNWTILPLSPGTGGLMRFNAAPGTTDHAFYHLRRW
jgi:hypothetical protein